MKSPEMEVLRERLEELGRRLAYSGVRTLTTRGRNLEAEVHLGQLTVRGARQLRILAEGNGAGEEDVGKFWFVVGFSRVGGPDVIPLE